VGASENLRNAKIFSRVWEVLWALDVDVLAEKTELLRLRERFPPWGLALAALARHKEPAIRLLPLQINIKRAVLYLYGGF
jgi:hypothetical protein